MGPSLRRDARNATAEALFRSSYHRLFALAYALLGNRATAEEVTMDAFVKAMGGWGRMKDHRLFEAYLRRSLINLAHKKWRRQAIEFRVNGLFQRNRGDETASWSVEQQETRREVWRAIGALPWGQRTCVVLSYFDGLSETEIADALGCAPGTVKRHLFRAREALRHSLGDQGETRDEEVRS